VLVGAPRAAPGPKNGFRSNRLPCVNVGIQPGERGLQPRDREVDEGADLGHREPALWGDEVHRTRRKFGVGEYDGEPAFPNGLRHLIGERHRQTVTRDRRGDRSFDAVDHEPRRKGDVAGSATRRCGCKGPRILSEGGHRHDRMLGRITRLDDRRSAGEIVEQEAIYLATLFELDVVQATGALEAKLGALPFGRQVLLVQAVLPTVFGRFWDHGSVRPGEVPCECLERLVVIAFRTIRLEDDSNRSDGKVFSPDTRDDAEGARGALFKGFIDTPGLATFDAIHRLMETPGFPVRRRRMREFARNRAESDSEAGAWSSADVYAFEADFLIAPRNPADLQTLALRRLADLQYDLLNADYAQSATVASLPDEVDVQNWMAD
jgi:hypothetical protein